MSNSGNASPDGSGNRHRRRVKLKRPPEKLYYKISEVAEMLEVKAYVLRFWEKEFHALRPRKNKAGNRIYQRKDIELLFRIRDLLYKEGFTIAGARQRLRAERKQENADGDESKETPPSDRINISELEREIQTLRREVEDLIELFA